MNKYMNILDFKGIKNLEQLNFKLSRDLTIINNLINFKYYRLMLEMTKLINLINSKQPMVLDNEIIKTFNKINSLNLNIDNIDLGASIGLGYFVDSNYTAEDLMYMDELDNFLEDQSEDRMILKVLQFLEKMDYQMQNDNDWMDQEQYFNSYIKYKFFELNKKYNDLMSNYIIEFKKAKIEVLKKTIQELNYRERHLLLIELDCIDLTEIMDSFIEDLNKAIYEIYLEELPLFDPSTNRILYENIDKLMEEDLYRLSDKLDKLSVELDKVNSKMLILKKDKKLYGEQLKAYSKILNPVTKQYMEAKWDDYNFKSNKKDKFTHD
jgi:hypothetical protein